MAKRKNETLTDFNLLTYLKEKRNFSNTWTLKKVPNNKKRTKSDSDQNFRVQISELKLEGATESLSLIIITICIGQQQTKIHQFYIQLFVKTKNSLSSNN